MNRSSGDISDSSVSWESMELEDCEQCHSMSPTGAKRSGHAAEALETPLTLKGATPCSSTPNSNDSDLLPQRSLIRDFTKQQWSIGYQYLRLYSTRALSDKSVPKFPNPVIWVLKPGQLHPDEEEDQEVDAVGGELAGVKIGPHIGSAGGSPSREKLRTPMVSGTYLHLVTHSDFFVDKSNFIGDVLNNRRTVQIFTYPNGFDTQIHPSMLRLFLEQPYDEEDGQPTPVEGTTAYNLFKEGRLAGLRLWPKLAISRREDAMKKLGTCPVLFVDFELRFEGATSYSEVFSVVKGLLSQLYKEHRYLQTALLWKKDGARRTTREKIEDHIKDIDRYIKNNGAHLTESEVWWSLHHLIKILHFHFDKKVTLIVSSFDSAMMQILHTGSQADVKKTKSLFTNMFVHILNPRQLEEHVERALFFGHSTMNRSLIPSQEGSTDHYSYLSHDMAYHFGLFPEEVKELLKAREWYSRETEAKVHARYGGFIVQTEEGRKYSSCRTASVYTYIQQDSAAKMGNFLSPGDEDKHLLYQLFKKASLREAVLLLLEGESIKVGFDEDQPISINEFLEVRSIAATDDNRDVGELVRLNALNHLYLSGYLSLEVRRGGVSPELYVRIPNAEVQAYLAKRIIASVIDLFPVSTDQLKRTAHSFRRLIDGALGSKEEIEQLKTQFNQSELLVHLKRLPIGIKPADFLLHSSLVASHAIEFGLLSTIYSAEARCSPEAPRDEQLMSICAETVVKFPISAIVAHIKARSVYGYEEGTGNKDVDNSNMRWLLLHRA